MDPIITSAIIGGGASLAGGIGNAFNSGSLNRKNRRWQEKMWHLQNAYNSPLQQRLRLEQAGINPNTAYGGMSQTAKAGDVGSSPYQNKNDWEGTASSMASNIWQAHQMKMQQQQLAAQTTLWKAQTEKTLNDSKLSALKTFGQMSENEIKRAEKLFRVSTLQERIDQFSTQGRNLEKQGLQLDANTRLTNLKGDFQQAYNEYSKKANELNLKLSQQQLDIGAQNLRKLVADNDFMDRVTELKYQMISDEARMKELERLTAEKFYERYGQFAMSGKGGMFKEMYEVIVSMLYGLIFN